MLDVLKKVGGVLVVVLCERRWRCERLLWFASASATCPTASILARSEMERSRGAYFEAVCACLLLTFGSGSSLMLRTVGLSHTMWSGSSKRLMLARFGLNPPCEPAHMLLTVCFRFTSWTRSIYSDFAGDMDRF